VPLAEVMQECRAMIEPQAHKHGVGMTYPRLAAPLFLSADRTRLKQILINLLSNAIKYNRPGGQVTVECAPCAPASIRLSVRDTGAGLTAAQLAQLFAVQCPAEYGAEEGTASA
jgi:signal transduction histidine kinase